MRAFGAGAACTGTGAAMRRAVGTANRRRRHRRTPVAG